MARADDHSPLAQPRPTFPGSTSSSNANAPPPPQSAPARSKTMEQDSLAPLPLHSSPPSLVDL